MTEPPGYPRELERDVALRDGATVHVRPDDAPRPVAAHDRLSTHSAYQRFFSAMRRLPPELRDGQHEHDRGEDHRERPARDGEADGSGQLMNLFEVAR